MLTLFLPTHTAHPSRSTSQLYFFESREETQPRCLVWVISRNDMEKEEIAQSHENKKFEKTQPSPVIRLGINHVCELYAV